MERMRCEGSRREIRRQTGICFSVCVAKAWNSVSVTSSLFSKKFAICCRATTCFSSVLRSRVENW